MAKSLCIIPTTNKIFLILIKVQHKYPLHAKILWTNIYLSSNNFTSYLSRYIRTRIHISPYSYSVFLSSIAGVMLSDYYFVRKGYFSVPYLYNADSDGPYWYAADFNPEAYVPSEVNDCR
jgi:Permease for cytosine/purines, uracil, thiamine, allantoin